MKSAKWTFGSSCLACMAAVALSTTTAQAQEHRTSIMELQSGNIALMLEYNGQLLSGNGLRDQDYVNIPLTSMPIINGDTREGSAGTGDSGQTTSTQLWGYADLLLACDSYDMVLYQYDGPDKSATEVYATTVYGDYGFCS